MAGHTALIKPKPLARAVEGGFTIDDFAYDQQARTLTCPNGLVRTITAKGRATFGAGCTGCPLRSRCTTAAQGRKIELHPEHALMCEHRTAARDEGFQADYKRHRPDPGTLLQDRVSDPDPQPTAETRVRRGHPHEPEGFSQSAHTPAPIPQIALSSAHS